MVAIVWNCDGLEPLLLCCSVELKAGFHGHREPVVVVGEEGCGAICIFVFDVLNESFA